jgi:hypothetical protein
MATYNEARKNVIKQLSELKEDLRELIRLNLCGKPVVNEILEFRGVKREYANFLRKFPKLLDRVENVLRMLTVPPYNQHHFRTLMTRIGEAVPHIYVKEATGESCGAQTAILLRVAAASYGMGKHPSYGLEAVNRRYLRFRAESPAYYAVLNSLVKQFRSEAPDVRLDRFIDSRGLKLLYDYISDLLNEMTRTGQ